MKRKIPRIKFILTKRLTIVLTIEWKGFKRPPKTGDY